MAVRRCSLRRSESVGQLGYGGNEAAGLGAMGQRGSLAVSTVFEVLVELWGCIASFNILERFAICFVYFVCLIAFCFICFTSVN